MQQRLPFWGPGFCSPAAAFGSEAYDQAARSESPHGPLGGSDTSVWLQHPKPPERSPLSPGPASAFAVEPVARAACGGSGAKNGQLSLQGQLSVTARTCLHGHCTRVMLYERQPEALGQPTRRSFIPRSQEAAAGTKGKMETEAQAAGGGGGPPGFFLMSLCLLSFALALPRGGVLRKELYLPTPASDIPGDFFWGGGVEIWRNI